MAKYNANIIEGRKAQVIKKRLNFARRWKIILERFGDFCRHCGNTYPSVVYDLHHPDGKNGRNETPSKIIGNGSEKAFILMLDKVELLCANCHRLHHAKTGNWAPARKK